MVFVWMCADEGHSNGIFVYWWFLSLPSSRLYHQPCGHHIKSYSQPISHTIAVFIFVSFCGRQPCKTNYILRLKIRNFSFCQRQLNSNSKLYLHAMRKNATNSLWIINFPNVFWQYFIKSFSYDTTGTHLYARRIYEMLKYCLSHVICPGKCCLGRL